MGTATAPASHQQGDRGPEGSRTGGVAARERGPEQVRSGVERRAHSVEQLLDAIGDETLADEHRRKERRDPAARPTDELDDQHHDRGDDHDLGRTEPRDHVQHVVGEAAAMVVHPRGDVSVERDDRGVSAYQQRQRTEEETADEYHRERGREEQPGRDLGIAALRNETAKAPMPDELLLHLARGARRRRIDRWPSERDESHQTSRREGNQNQRH